jgi:predicted aspartyl protease
MRRRHFLLGSLTQALLGLPGCASLPTAASPEANEADVPMAFDDPHVSVTVAVNGVPLRFVLDTGADGNVVRPEVAASLGLPLSDGTVPASGGGGAIAPVHATTLRELAVGGARLRDALAYVIPLPVELRGDGILGASFFRAFTPRFDYAAGRLRLTPAARAQAPAGARRLPLQVLPSGKVLVQADAAGVEGWYSVDTGAANTLTLFTPTVERLGLRARFGPGRRMVTGLTVSGLEHGDIVRLPWLAIGGFTLAQPVAELSLARVGLFGSDGWTGNLGGELWRRFAVTVDMRAGALFLEPNAELGAPFAAPRSGLASRWREGRLTVVEALDESPAAEAGLRAGDVVTSVDGVAVGLDDPSRLRRALRQPVGTPVTLRLVGADGATRDATLVLRDLV